MQTWLMGTSPNLFNGAPAAGTEIEITEKFYGNKFAFGIESSKRIKA